MFENFLFLIPGKWSFFNDNNNSSLDSFYTEDLWSLLGSIIQNFWDVLLDFTGEDQFNLWVFWSTAWTMTLYWILGSILTVMYLTNKPAFLMKYKVQPNGNEDISQEKIIKMMLTVLFNHTIMGMSCYIVMFQILKFWGLPNIRELPPLSTLLRDIFVAVIFEEIGFYYSHLTLHHKYLYKTVHKKHHEWSAPVALATYHCHPLEHILSNFLPPHLGMILMGSHFVTFLIVMVGVLVGSLTLHSGFHFPYFPSSQAHDYHHLKFNQCYGVFGVLDWLHGTDQGFRNTIYYDRHLILLSTLSADEEVPDLIKKL